jgi:hypothetical protein
MEPNETPLCSSMYIAQRVTKIFSYTNFGDYMISRCGSKGRLKTVNFIFQDGLRNSSILDINASRFSINSIGYRNQERLPLCNRKVVQYINTKRLARKEGFVKIP